MLQFLRKRAQSTFFQIIVVIIALVFVFWGVGANLSGDGQAALTVNGEEISFQDYQRAYDQAYQRMSDQFGGNIPKGFAESIGLKSQVVDQLVQTTLLRQGAAEMGLYVSSEEVRRTIEGMVQFQENGVFNIDRYKDVLAASRLAPTKFEQSMRIDSLSQMAAREVGDFAVVATDFEISEIYAQINEEITLDFAVFSRKDFSDAVEVDDEKLKSWFATVEKRYTTLPEVKLSYLPFTYEAVAQQITIDEAEVKDYYQKNLADFTINEQRRARHILLKADTTSSEEVHQSQQQKAQEILEELRDGADFAEMAIKVSQGPSAANGGDLGFFSRGQMVAAFDNAVFAMEPGQLSEVVQTSFGYHIIYLEEINPKTVRPFTAVQEQITRTLQTQRAEGLAFQMANDAYEAIINAGSLAAYAAQGENDTILATEFFNRETAPAELAGDPGFLDAIFSLGKGELSSLVAGQSGYAIFFAEDLKEPFVPPFIELRDRVAEDFRAAQSVVLAEAAATAFLDELKAGAVFADAAGQKGLEVIRTMPLKRSGANADSEFPAPLLESAFLLTKASPLPENIGSNGDFYVYSLVSRELPEIDHDSDEIAAYRVNLLNFKQQQILSAWLQNLRVKAKITQHENLL